MRDYQCDVPLDLHAREGMMRGQSITDEETAEIRRLHAEGLSLRAVARGVGRHRTTVSRVCARLGLSFDRSQTAAAVKAQQLDAAGRRSRLAVDLLEDAERLRAQMWQPAVVWAFGGRDGEYAEHRVAEPPAADKRTLMQAATAALAAHLRLVDHDADGGLGEARSVLDGFMEAVARRADELGRT